MGMASAAGSAAHRIRMGVERHGRNLAQGIHGDRAAVYGTEAVNPIDGNEGSR